MKEAESHVRTWLLSPRAWVSPPMTSSRLFGSVTMAMSPRAFSKLALLVQRPVTQPSSSHQQKAEQPVCVGDDELHCRHYGLPAVLQCLLHMPQLLNEFAVLAQYRIEARAGACPANIVIHDALILLDSSKKHLTQLADTTANG